MHTKDHFLTATTKDEKWLVLVGRPSLAASGWRARRPAPLGYFHTNDHFLTDTTKHENVAPSPSPVKCRTAAPGCPGQARAPALHFHIKATKTLHALRGLALGLALLGLAGCFPPSALEMDYGNSVRNNVAQQVVNPRAGYNPKPAVGLSPQAAANEMERYDKGFKEDPKAMGKQLDTQIKQQ